MGAIKHQGFITDSDRLSSRYGGVPVIYVESEEDHYVFAECWFRDRQSTVEFKPAATKASVSGCNGVIEAVNMEKQAGNPAWGIVDRDSVMAHNRWDLVYETNDAVFEAAKPFGSSVKVLCRWEMESYLVDGEAMEHQRACFGMQVPRAENAVYSELLDHCHALIPHAAINAVHHLHHRDGLGDGFTNRFVSRADVEGEIQLVMLPRLPESARQDYDRHLAQADHFDTSELPPAERVNSLLRRVHGKAVLERFCNTHRSEIQNAKISGHLAKRIEEQGRIPNEIDAFVTQVAQTA